MKEGGETDQKEKCGNWLSDTQRKFIHNITIILKELKQNTDNKVIEQNISYNIWIGRYIHRK